jgi:hypothetical protein
MEKSRRGRRPKNQQASFKTTEGYNINVDTPIIAHLPIDLSEVMNEQVDDIFIKNDSNDVEIKQLKRKIEELNSKLCKYEKQNKPSVIICENNCTSKCWWDREYFNTPVVEMPEAYLNGQFMCSGKFCSWECMMAYNIDINDENITKRTSLIHLMYKKTYGNFKTILPAPSWKILEHNGGVTSIEDFRLNLTLNDIEYTYIKPPMISRISYIEKIPVKKDADDNINSTDLILKRNKPLKSSKYSLESIMGLKKIASVPANN